MLRCHLPSLGCRSLPPPPPPPCTLPPNPATRPDRAAMNHTCDRDYAPDEPPRPAKNLRDRNTAGNSDRYRHLRADEFPCFFSWTPLGYFPFTLVKSLNKTVQFFPAHIPVGPPCSFLTPRFCSKALKTLLPSRFLQRLCLP